MKKSTLIAEFDQAVHIVDSSFPSLYTKEDVIKVLRNLETTLKDFISDEEKTNVKLSNEQFDELIETITNDITGLGMDVVHDYELSMNYKEVELDSLDLDSSVIEDQVKTSIRHWIESEDDCDC